MIRYLVGDVETTGTTEQDRTVEVAWIEIDADLNEIDRVHSLIDPQMLISPSAMGVHHITNEMVADAPTWEELFEQVIPNHFAPDDEVVLVAHNCLTGDHEVRTAEGWVRLDELQDGTLIMQWDPVTEGISLVPSVLVKQHFEGHMLEWDTQFHKGCYTPEHRMYFKTRSAAEWDVLTASEYAKRGPNTLSIPVSGWLDSEKPLDITPDEARVLEMIRADGNTYLSTAGTPHVRFKFKKKRKVQRCAELLENLGISYVMCKGEKDSTVIRLHTCERTRKLANLLGIGKDKAYGPWVLQLSLEARRALLDELQHWDGHVASAGGKAAVTLHSSKKEDVEWLSDLAHFSGSSATVTYDIPNTRGFSKPDGVLHRVSVRPRGKVKTLVHPSPVIHNGPVYCVNVPTGAFMVRRKGVVWVTGNCKFDQRFFKLGSYVPVVEEVCTLRLARYFWPDAENHKLQTLRYLHKLTGGEGAHGALEDCETGLALLRFMCQSYGISLNELCCYTRQPLTVKNMYYGKHKGLPLKELPRGYRVWLMGTDLDEDLRYSLEQL